MTKIKINGLNKCSKCKQLLPDQEFYVVKETEKLTSRCKKCDYEAHRNYIEKSGYKWRVGKEKKYAHLMVHKKLQKPIHGIHRHHWSYKKEHWLDVIELSPSDHKRLHRMLVYDGEHLMYRTTDGTLLDTKEKHINYYDVIKLKISA